VRMPARRVARSTASRRRTTRLAATTRPAARPP
jgi:hypothetical protein